ncbi:hypothetical protein L596_011156 [Steinernema carpocapsae]|uniref:Actin-related protein 10 n=1 Tax=Steinernema carpocapsae TaxID=34508 RepID=A0A4U5NTT0_STECR|nr:hypothetical protein L596_011156 [Steinernema carpocapsae]
MLPYASQRSNSSMARVDSSYVPVLESKSVVVIDFGSRYTRIGFNGDFCPSILRSEIVDPESGEVKPLFADGRSEEEDRRILHLFLRKIFFKHLLCSVKDRRILIVESILTPTKNRQRIASVLFETATFSPPAILFAPSHLLHTIPFSISSAMVVDIGFTETLLVPIYEGVTMLNKYECSPICSKLLEERICVLLKKHAHIEMENGEKREILEDDVILLLKMNVIEDIAVRLCFATKMERGNMIQEDNVDFEMAIACPVGFLKEMIVVPGIVRESAAEIFFKSSHCDDDRSIPELILDSITKLPIDMRRPMISHIAVVGGSARMPGFLARLKSEITRLLQEDERYNFLRKLADSLKFYVYSEAPVELYGAWLGGSLLASVDIMQTKSLTREEWLKKNKTVPDWTEKIDEYFTFEKEN